MARGTKLDLFVGAQIDEGWQQVDDAKASTAHALLAPDRHQLVFRFEKRQGKPVTLVGPFALEDDAMKTQLKTLKQKLGTGGTIEAEWLLFQGDLKAKLLPLLEAAGFRFKKK